MAVVRHLYELAPRPLRLLNAAPAACVPLPLIAGPLERLGPEPAPLDASGARQWWFSIGGAEPLDQEWHFRSGDEEWDRAPMVQVMVTTTNGHWSNHGYVLLKELGGVWRVVEWRPPHLIEN